MITHFLAHHHVADADLLAHVAGNAGKDDGLCAKFAAQHLGGGGSVGLAHAGAEHHHFLIAQAALMVLYPGVLLHLNAAQAGAQLIHFVGHSAHNAVFHVLFLSAYTLNRNSMMSPSCTTYSLPSVCCRPLAFTAAMS